MAALGNLGQSPRQLLHKIILIAMYGQGKMRGQSAILDLVLCIQTAMSEVDALEISAQAALADIRRLTSRVLAQAFDAQGDLSHV